MLRNLCWALLGAPLLVVLAGCCGNTACDCQDLLADSLYFSFATTGPNAFSAKEIATVYLARYNGADSLRLRVSRDSLPLPQDTRTTQTLRNHLANDFKLDVTGLVVISNNAPFSVVASNSNLSKFVYRLYVPQDSANTFKKRTFTTFTFDRITLNGRYQGDGCCTCYENLQKQVRVRGGSSYPGTGRILTVTEKGTGINRVPIITQLTK